MKFIKSNVLTYLNINLLFYFLIIITASEGAFKKLKTEPMTSVGSISASHSGHTPTTATCPTPARRRHRTTFTQVSNSATKYFHINLLFNNLIYCATSIKLIGFNFRLFRNNLPSSKLRLQSPIIPISIAGRN